MQITFNIPDDSPQRNAYTQADWLREIAVALFQKELVTLETASTIAAMQPMQFQTLLCDRGIANQPGTRFAIAPGSSDPDSATDPLFQLAGCINSDLTDVAEHHDQSLGQAIYEEMRRSE